MTAPPTACSGVISSASSSALPMVASGGSRFMNSAVRNGPMRIVEANTPMMPVVTATLTAITASQPPTVSGGCQSHVASESSASSADEETSECQVISLASTPCSAARVTSSITTRQQAAPSAATMPQTASPAG